MTVLAEQYGAICKWFEPNGAFPNGRALVSLNGISKIYTPDECKVVNNKIVVNANEFRFAFDIGLNAGEAYLKKLLDEYEYLPWNLEHDEKNKTYTLSLLDSGIPPKVYKVGENGVRIENDRLVVNTDEFYYHFELRLDPTETYLEKFAKESGGKYTFDESSQTATVTVTTTKGTITKEYHVSESSYLYTDSGIALYYYSPVWMDPSGNIVVDKQLLYKDFYGHLNILSSTIGDVISFYYENGKLAYVGDSLPAENASDNYIKCTNSLISEYISEILGMSSDKCYIENDWDNFSVLDMKNYSWNGKKYMSTEYSLNLSINGEKFKIKPHFVFNANRDVYVEKASILSALKETLEEGKYGSYDSLPTYKSNNGYTNIMNYLKKNTIIPQESIEYSNGLFKIKGQELNINTINIKDSASQEGDIYSYAKAYELYTELKKIAPEYLITHWVESYGEHEEGLGHKKVLIEKYNEGCNIEHDISLNWHDTGEYTGFISGCPDCNSKAVKVEEYINSKYNIPEIVQKKGINDNVGLFTGGYYPFYYLDKELVFPGMFGKKTYEYESLYLIEGVDLYADPSAIDSVIQKETGVLPVLGDLNLSVARNSLYESETLTILATCPNAHHIFVRIVDENGNTVYQKRTAGNSASINTILNTAGVYKIYAAARNASEDVINSTFTETLNPVIITVKKLPQLEVVNVLDNEIEVRASFPIDGDSSNTLLVKNTSGQSWTEIGSGIKNGTTQLIKGLTSGTNYTICMRWVENGVQMEKTVEVETPVTKSSGKYGDLNADGKINSTDYAILKRYILGTIDKLPVTDGSYIADLNADGRINSTDYTLLKRYLLSPESTVFPAEKFLSETPYVKLTNLKNNEVYVAIPQDDGSKAINIIGEGTNCHHIGLFIGNSKGTETLKDIQYNSRLNDTLEYEYIFPVSDSGTYSIYLAGRNAHDGIKTSTLDKSETVSINVIVPGSKSTILEQAQNDLITVKSLSPQIDLGTSGADGLWGPNTAASILAFQQWCVQEWASYNNTSLKDANKHLENVKATGLLDRATLIALRIQAEKHKNMTITNNPYNIQENVYSQYVEMAQKYLEALNEVRFTNLFDLGPQGIDGKWSPGGYTYTAIKLFQKEYGLPETGILDKTTFTELSNAGKEALKFVAASKIPPSLSLYSGTTITMYDMNGAAHVVKNNIDDISYAICYNYWGFTPLNTGSYTQALRNYYNSSVSGFTSFEAWLAEKYNLVDTNTPTPFKYYYENVWGKDIIYPAYTEWIKLFGYIIDSPPEVPDPIEPESGSENIETLNKVLDVIQTILDVVGFFPGIGDVADGINVGICLLRKDLLGAVFSGIALIPAIGSVIAAPLKTIFKVAGNVPQIKAAINILAKVFGGANKVVDGLTSALNTVKGLIKGIPDLVESLIHNSFIRNLIGSDGVQAILAMAKVIRNKIDDLVGKTDEVVATIKNIIRGSVHGLEQLMLKILEGTETVFEVVRETLELQDGSLMLKFLDGAETIITKAELQAAMIAKGMGDKLDEVWQFCKVGCFSGDILVVTKEGPKRIDEIKEGELVYSKNVNTGDFDYKKVLQVYIKSSKEFIKLKIEDEDIRTTPTHPFFVEEGWWKTAQNIKQGDRIVTASGQLKEVLAIEIEILSEPERIYNLNVEDYHTYFVGASGLLVHNDCSEAMTQIMNKILKATDGEIYDLFTRSSSSHLVERHLNKTINDLVNRALTDPNCGPLASAFTNQSTAIKAIRENLRGNATRIKEWLESSSNVITISFDNGYSLGNGVYKGTSTVVDASKLTKSELFLVKDATSSTGFNIITGYPTL